MQLHSTSTNITIPLTSVLPTVVVLIRTCCWYLWARLRDERRSFSLRAVHVDHSLQADSRSWAEHCRKVCRDLRVPLEVCQCTVKPGTSGPEASARQARYRQFSQVLHKGEHLLLAQHAEDQAETFLLQALRGQRTGRTGRYAGKTRICRWHDDPAAVGVLAAIAS